MNQKIILWSIASEPLFLAAVAWFLKRTGSLPPAGSAKSGEVVLLVFAAVSLSLAWAGYQFANGLFAPKPSTLGPGRAKPPFGHQLVAVSLASGPGVLGFAHYLIYGVGWVLLVFNLGAFVLAARYVLDFAADLQ